MTENLLKEAISSAGSAARAQFVQSPLDNFDVEQSLTDASASRLIFGIGAVLHPPSWTMAG
jgi:hypothetical protein